MSYVSYFVAIVDDLYSLVHRGMHANNEHVYTTYIPTHIYTSIGGFSHASYSKLVTGTE